MPDGERTMVPDPGANQALTPQDLPDDLFAAGRHLHLSGYTLLGRRQPHGRAVGPRPGAAARHDHERRRRLRRARSPTPAPPGSSPGSPASTSCSPTSRRRPCSPGCPRPLHDETVSARPRRRAAGRAGAAVRGGDGRGEARLARRARRRRRAGRGALPRPSRSTSSTPPAPATRSRPGSCPPGATASTLEVALDGATVPRHGSWPGSAPARDAGCTVGDRGTRDTVRTSPRCRGAHPRLAE